MEVSISIDPVSRVPLSRLEEVVTEAKKLSTVKINHNKEVEAMLKDPVVIERKIFVTCFSTPSIPIMYRIEDYAFDEGRVVLLGCDKYTAEGPIKT